MNVKFGKTVKNGNGENKIEEKILGIYELEYRSQYKKPCV